MSVGDAVLDQDITRPLADTLQIDLDEIMPPSVKEDILNLDREGVDPKFTRLRHRITAKLLSELRSHPGLDTLQILQAERAAFFYVRMRMMEGQEDDDPGSIDMKLYKEMGALFSRQAEALQKESRSVAYDEAFRRVFIRKVYQAVAQSLRIAIPDQSVLSHVSAIVKNRLMELLETGD